MKLTSDETLIAIDKVIEANAGRTATETYLREALNLFAKDPPDNSYQHGFLDAIIAMATEVAGFRRSDPDILAATSANRLGQSPDPKVARLRFGENSPS